MSAPCKTDCDDLHLEIAMIAQRIKTLEARDDVPDAEIWQQKDYLAELLDRLCWLAGKD